MNRPLVTIAIPAFKNDFLEEAISSALSQTYPNLEVLVVDDASPFNLQSIVGKFDDERLRYYRNERNLGKDDPSRNWNRCLELAKGEFICILCDDDIYEKDMVEELVGLTTAHPCNNVFRSGIREIDECGKTTNYYPLSPEELSVAEYVWHLYTRATRQTISEWMIRRSALQDIGGYVDCPKAWGADCTTVISLGKSGIISSSKRMVSFRRSDRNITGMSYEYNQAKIIGWNKQRDIARNSVIESDSPDKEMILDAIETEYRQELKFLVKHASIRELLEMKGNRDRYHVSTSLFYKGVWANILLSLHIRKK